MIKIGNMILTPRMWRIWSKITNQTLSKLRSVAGESVTELEGQSDSANMEEGDKSQEDEEEENQDEKSRKETEKSMDTDDNLRKRDGGHNTVVDSFKKVTRAEWSKMTYKKMKRKRTRMRRAEKKLRRAW